MTFHISHNDLDGYGAQLVSRVALRETEVEFYNSNYGKELDQKIDIVLSKIKSEDKLLITDLNLIDSMAEKIEEAREKIGFEVKLLDHHMTGAAVAVKYDWYTLDETKCGTLLTFEYFRDTIRKKIKLNIDFERFEKVVNMIQSYDLWKEESELIDHGRALNSLLMESNRFFPPALENLNRTFLLDTLQELGTLLACYEGNQVNPLDDEYTLSPIAMAEMHRYSIQREWFEGQLSFNVKSSDKPLSLVRVQYMYQFILDNNLKRDIEFNGAKGEIYFGLSSIFQEFSSMRNSSGEVDFVVNINPRGFLSFRSKGKQESKNVGQIAIERFNGGGHFNAAGGSLLPEDFRGRKTEEELIQIFMEKLK